MRSFAVFLVAASLAAAAPAARAQKVVLGMSGWTGFSPLALADKADILTKNGLSIQDVIRWTMAAQPAAQAFVTGQGDAAVTYVPYLSTVRANPDAGRILVTSKDYPVVIDVLVFRTDFIKQHPQVVKK